MEEKYTFFGRVYIYVCGYVRALCRPDSRRLSPARRTALNRIFEALNLLRLLITSASLFLTREARSLYILRAGM